MDTDVQTFFQAQETQISDLTRRVAELEGKLERIEGRLDARGHDDHDDHEQR